MCSYWFLQSSSWKQYKYAPSCFLTWALNASSRLFRAWSGQKVLKIIISKRQVHYFVFSVCSGFFFLSPKLFYTLPFHSVLTGCVATEPHTAHLWLCGMRNACVSAGFTLTPPPLPILSAAHATTAVVPLMNLSFRSGHDSLASSIARHIAKKKKVTLHTNWSQTAEPQTKTGYM